MVRMHWRVWSPAINFHSAPEERPEHGEPESGDHERAGTGWRQILIVRSCLRGAHQRARASARQRGHCPPPHTQLAVFGARSGAR